MLSKSDFLLSAEAPMHLWALKNDRYTPRPVTAHERFLQLQAGEIEAFAARFLAEACPPAALTPQQTFTSGQFLARPDFLLTHPDGSIDLVEVKSSTSVKPEHLQDIAFQALVLEGQVPLRRLFQLHLNNGYAKDGELNPRALFVLAEVTNEARALFPEVALRRQEALNLIASPVPPPASAAGCTSPRTCPCPDLCFPPLPDYPVFHLPRLGRKARSLTDQGILSLTDIPDDFPLSDIQRTHIMAARSGPQIDRAGLTRFLSSLAYPLHFLDYETFPPGLPVLDGFRPYEHVVFQFSLHRIDHPGAAPQHAAYLHLQPTDPSAGLAQALAEAVAPVGTILVWNQPFEKGRNRELAGRLPGSADFFLDLNARIIDLMDVFSKGLYVHRDFRGSASLKSVLPVLVPELDYSELAISQGDEAMLAWHALAFGGLSPEEKAEIRQDLEAYSRLDTHAMVRIWEELQKIAG